MNMKISDRIMYKELGIEYLKDIKKISMNLRNNYLLPITLAVSLYACGSGEYNSSKRNGLGNPVVYACNDNQDNDGDTLVDWLDPGCSSAKDDNEFNAPPVVYACNDNQDNDGDGLVDMLDSGCSSLTDDDEYNPLVNQSPFITSTPLLEVMVKDNYTYDVNATDADGDVLTYYLNQSPLGMVADPVTGLIEFQTNYFNLGRNNIIAIADDGKATAEQSFTLNVKYNYQSLFYPYSTLPYSFARGSQDNEKVVVCETSCSRTEDSFNNKVNGIFLGSKALEEFVGTRPFIGTTHDISTFPIELHLEKDTKCSSSQGEGGGSTTYSGRTPLICLYTYNKVDESSLNAQELAIHEETHFNFTKRAWFGGEEDFVRAIAAVITDHSGLNP